MSLEQAMEKQAAASEKLANAMNRYADVIEKFGLKIENDNAAAAAAGGAETTTTTTKAEKPAKADKATKAAKADKAPPADNDGFDDAPSGAPKDLTIDKVKAKLFEVKDAYGDKTPALKVATDLGYASINDIKPADFEKCWIEAERLIAAAP